MHDIHGNIVQEGDFVYALTTPHASSKYKRLFYSKVEEVSKGKCVVFCYETERKVSLTRASIIKPLE